MCGEWFDPNSDSCISWNWASSAFTGANHWHLLHSKPLRTCEKLGWIVSRGHRVSIRLVFHHRCPNNIWKLFHRSLVHLLRQLLMRDNRLDPNNKHRKWIHIQSESSSLADHGTQCVRWSDSCIESVTFSPPMEHWRSRLRHICIFETSKTGIVHCLCFRCDFLSDLQQLVPYFDGSFLRRKKHRLSISVVTTLGLEEIRLDSLDHSFHLSCL
jgi:hypothetical protein